MKLSNRVEKLEKSIKRKRRIDSFAVAPDNDLTKVIRELNLTTAEVEKDYHKFSTSMGDIYTHLERLQETPSVHDEFIKQLREQENEIRE